MILQLNKTLLFYIDIIKFELLIFIVNIFIKLNNYNKFECKLNIYSICLKIIN